MPAVSPLHLSGPTFTGRVLTSAVVAGRFIKAAGAAVIPFPNGDAVKVNHATAAGDPVVGVSLYDGAVGSTVTFAAPGNVVPVQASAAIAAGDYVTTTAAGKAVTVAGRGTALGIAWTAAAAADDFVFVQLV